MPLDPSIILGAKPPQFDMAQFSPMNAFTTAMKLKQLSQEGELNAMTLGERKRLQSFLGTDPDLNSQEARYALATQFGEAGRKLAEGVTNIGKAGTEEADRRNKLVVSKTGLYRDALIDVNDQRSAIKWLQTQQNDPDMLGSPVTKISIMDAARSIPADPEGFAQWKQQAALGLSEYIKQNKPVISQVNREGQTDILSRGGLGGPLTTLGTYKDVPLPADVLAQKKDIARAGASNITQTTEKKYGEVFAGKMADSDIAKMTNAEKAPQLAESANRIIDLVKQGNVFTGPIADIKLNVARGLNVLGADNNEKIANTESLIAATGKSTLDAISAANLGTGQGFTDKDLRFLQGIAGGKIDFRPETLTELARLQHLAATRSAEAWNKRSARLPKSATEGTSLSLEPIKVPPLSPSAIFATNPKTGARIQSLDGGANWTPVGGK
jgi:hypothetical protein